MSDHIPTEGAGKGGKPRKNRDNKAYKENKFWSSTSFHKKHDEKKDVKEDD